MDSRLLATLNAQASSTRDPRIARARAQHDGDVLRAGHESKRNWRSTRGVRITCVPIAYSSGRAIAVTTESLEGMSSRRHIVTYP